LEIDLLEGFHDSWFNFAPRHSSLTQAKGYVLEYGHVGPERVVLEHEANIPLPGRHMVHRASVKRDRTFVREYKAGDDPEQSRLAATAGSEEGKEFTPADMEIDATNDPLLAVTLADAVKSHFGRLHHR
jgi:hypothetical protein